MLRLAVSPLGPAAHLPGTFVLPTLTLPTRILSRGQINSFEAGLETFGCYLHVKGLGQLEKEKEGTAFREQPGSSQPGGAWDVPLRRAEGWQ